MISNLLDVRKIDMIIYYYTPERQGEKVDPEELIKKRWKRLQMEKIDYIYLDELIE